MKSKSVITFLFTVVMLFCVLFSIWYLPALRERLFQIEDTQISLETSRGRERRQQREYEDAMAALPEVQAELERIIPLNEAMLAEKKSLKAELKELKKEKENLLKTLQEGPDAEEVSEHE